MDPSPGDSMQAVASYMQCISRVVRSNQRSNTFLPQKINVFNLLFDPVAWRPAQIIELKLGLEVEWLFQKWAWFSKEMDKLFCSLLAQQQGTRFSFPQCKKNVAH